jgi:hypothetical protein
MRTLGALIVMVLVVASCAAPDPVATPTTTTVVSMTSMAMDDAGEMGGMDHMDDGMEHSDDHEHDEGRLEWDGGAVPEVSIDVTGDNDEGWTVTTSISNFTLADMSATEHVPGEGHAHIWVDGQVFTMISQETTVIPQLDPGTHEIMVTLSSNTHLDYVHEGEPLMARTTVEVAGEQADHPVIVVTIAGGEVTVDPAEPEVAIGDDVEVRITSDVTDSIHIHGYDALGALEPGVETIVRFTADIPGIFEVELESAGTHVFDLAVR